MNKILYWGNNIFLPLFSTKLLYIHIGSKGYVFNEGQPMTYEQVNNHCKGGQQELSSEEVITLGDLHCQRLKGFISTPCMSEII